MRTLNKPQSFIDAMTKERKERGMTQIQLSKLSGMPDNYINKVENGVKNPTMVTLCKIYNTLGIKIILVK